MSAETYVPERTWAGIDLDAARENLRQVRALYEAPVKTCAVVKADAYGHGAVLVAKALSEDTDFFAVATAAEAFELRENGITKPILVLSPVAEADYSRMIEEEIRVTLFEAEKAKTFSETAAQLGKNGYYHIKVDTGMHRIGLFADENGIAEIQAMEALPMIEAEGIFTHFYASDEEDLAPAQAQLATFTAFVERLKQAGISIPLVHAANSAAAIRMKAAGLNMLRLGICLYGLPPSLDADFSAVSLKPVMSLYSEVTYVKTIPAGVSLSYGGTYVTTRPTRVATIGTGYADGYARTLSNKADVLIRGKRVPVIGRVCMDQMMADVTDLPDVKEGDRVTLIGKDGEEEITMAELGELSGRFHYEFACCINKRVPRVPV